MRWAQSDPRVANWMTMPCAAHSSSTREAALRESGDMLLTGADVYAELGELLAGTKPKPEAEITVFKSLGLAVEDLAAGRLVLDALGKS